MTYLTFSAKIIFRDLKNIFGLKTPRSIKNKTDEVISIIHCFYYYFN